MRITALKKMKLPRRGSKPKRVKGNAVPGFAILSPGGGEIYKVTARFATQPAVGPCTINVVWSGGPPGPAFIFLIDIKHWANTGIGVAVQNVAGSVGVASVTLPPNFLPTDDHPTANETYPQKPGRYQMYIVDGETSTWTYGPEFVITYSE